MIATNPRPRRRRRSVEPRQKKIDFDELERERVEAFAAKLLAPPPIEDGPQRLGDILADHPTLRSIFLGRRL